MSSNKIDSLFTLDTNAPIKFKKENLYSFQKNTVTELEKFHKADGNESYGILKIPTGGGKTKTACYWITSKLLAKNYKLVWITHRRELLEQAAREFNNMSGLLKGLAKKPTARIVVGGHCSGSTISPSDDLLFVSIQTLSKGKGENAFKNFINKNKNSKILFVIDEAHHSEASTYKYIIKEYVDGNKNYSLLGLTATPTRTVESEQGSLLKLFKNKIIEGASLTELITQEILAKPIPSVVKTGENFEKDFTQKEKEYIEQYRELPAAVLKRIANSAARNKVIVDTYMKNKKVYGKTLIFATDIIHCKTLADEFNSAKGIKVGYVHSGKDDNEIVLKEFQENKYNILINIEKLTEGYDCPDIQTVFLARPTHSEILFSQMVGRGLRGPNSKPPGTEKCYLVSFMDHWEKFTGWLDVTKVLDYSEPEPEDKSKKEKIPVKTETRIIPWDLIDSIYNDLSKSLSHIPYKENIIDYLPHGWYNIGFFDEENDTPTSRRILVFDNQIYAWKEVVDCLSKSKKKPSAKEIESLFTNYFGDLPIPSVIYNDLVFVIDFVFEKGKFIEPDYHTFHEKSESEPQKLAKKILDKKLSGEAKRNEISKWFYNHKILLEIFDNDELAFARQVNDEIHYIEYPEDTHFKIFSGNPFIQPNKKELNIPEPDDAVLKKYLQELKNNKTLFPDGFDYKIEVSWTKRIMKSYFGIAYTDKNKIKINRILNEKTLDRNIAKYVLYHEMLHFSYSLKHTKEFRKLEWKFPNAAELDSDIDNLHHRYDIPSWKKGC